MTATALRLTALCSLLLIGCASRGPSPAPPWRGAPLAASDIPPIYEEEWSAADNRERCGLVAFRSLGEAGRGATPRRATFSGGWAVAYDLPETRSAFGVAGTGVRSGDPSYDDWPYSYEWQDGSRADYGPEGGTGPNQLAYLRISGQDCLYNVWSRLGREHLELLLRELRRVE